MRSNREERGPIMATVCGVARGLQVLSPVWWWRRARPGQGIDAWDSERRDSAFVEWYVIGCLAFEVAALLLAPNQPPWVQGLACVLIGLRVVDIVRAAVDINLLGGLPGSRPEVAYLQRSAVLAIINFFELMLCFAVVYASSFLAGRWTATEFDPLYFSAITQLTVGYGDIAPQGLARLVVGVHTCLTFVLALIALSRLVSLLPRPKEVLASDEN